MKRILSAKMHKIASVFDPKIVIYFFEMFMFASKNRFDNFEITWTVKIYGTNTKKYFDQKFYRNMFKLPGGR